VTSETYAGTYSSATPSKFFVYDTATVNSVAMANAKTRLAEAYTCVSPCSSKITDLGFSYTARGETSDLYQSTLHSGGYYHLGQTYWANGGPNQLNAASCSGLPCFPGLPMFTYGADGEGRPSTVTAGSGQNPVTGTTYNLYSSPPQTTVNFGSGDSDVFNYDSNTGRTTQYKFNVGSQPQSMVGALSWNPNGSLGSLGITDPFNSSGSQTCNYTHDDLERIGSTPTVPGVNCVNGSQQTVWSQTFSFDAFGNINKSGNSTFSASYSPATNRMTSIGGSTPSYDSNGNVTNDFLHTYAWDAEGRPVTIDTVGVTYDALGRMVEQNRSGTYTEIAYAPTGDKLALMSGQTLQKAFVPLPGGATAVYTSSGLEHYRHADWLGSARLATTPSRTVYGDVAYAPYGETYAQSGTADFSFTGMNQDTVGNEYDFPAREYGIQGRWPSPDPGGLAAVDPANPQSWNRYAYVMNNPLAATDPTGMWWLPLTDSGGDGGCGFFDLFCLHPCFPFGCFAPCSFFGCTGEGGRGGGRDHDSGPPPPPPPGGYGNGIDLFGSSFLPGEISGIPVGLICWFQPCAYGLPGFKISITVTQSLPPPQAGNSTLDQRTKALADAFNKTGIQSLGNPCTVATFYVASALGGASGGAAVGGEAAGVASAVKEATVPYWPIAFNWLYRQAMTGFPAIRFITKAYNTTTQAVQAGCNAVQ
jgi:RHS repeat-associated protein